MRVKRFLLMFMFLLLIGICFSNVSYADENAEYLPAKVGVDINKPWSIRFSNELMQSTVNTQNVIVLDGNNSQVAVNVALQGDGKTVVVSPKDKYSYGKTYTLSITQNVKSKNNDNLNKAVKMTFTTKNETDSTGTYTVCIDAGHGGSDKNITGPLGTQEKNVDLSVALKIGTILSSSGVNVIYTRTSDTDVSNDSRVKISNDASADYYVSIHCNTATATATGTDILYVDGNNKALGLATAIQSSMYSSTGLKQRKLINSTLLSEAQNNNAAVVKVCLGFLSNPDEEKKLSSDDFQNKCAQAIASAILNSKQIDNVNPIVSAKNAVLSITAGQSFTLPKSVAVEYKDGTSSQQSVTWNTSGVNNQVPGTYTCTGRMDGFGKTIYGTVVVMPKDSAGKPVVCIDAGHGGKDSGAVGYSGLKEADVTLQIGLKVGSILEQKGVNVVYTRKDNNVSWPTGGDQDDLVRDLQTRCDISNAVNAQYFVAIHCNSNDSSAPKGTETYYHASSIAGKVFAGNVQSALIAAINSQDRGIKDYVWYVIRPDHINAPAILTEIGFVSNPDEEALLKSASYQQLYAQAIANGILKTLGK